VAQGFTTMPEAAAGVAPSPASHEHVALEQVMHMLRRLDDRLQRLEDQARDQAAAGERLRNEVEGLSAGLDVQKKRVNELHGECPEAGLQCAAGPEAEAAAAPAAPPAAPPQGARAAPTPAAALAAPQDPTPAESALALPAGALKRQPVRRSHSTEPAQKEAAHGGGRGTKLRDQGGDHPANHCGATARPPDRLSRSRTPVKAAAGGRSAAGGGGGA
jgi:hypothetical protein